MRRVRAFTVVELLVVIVVIGIIAGITLISYTGTTQKVTIASLKSDLDGAAKLLKMDQVINGFYPTNIEDANSGRGLSASPGTIYEYFSSPTGFCIMATKNEITYRITDNSQSELGDCSGYGLATNLDAGNSESIAGKSSIINWDSWTVGAGGAVGYATNGDGNSRILDSNPWGNLDIVWDVSNQDALSDADGGWNGSSFSIDSTKKYRFSVFVRRKVIGNGTFYLGVRGSSNVVANRTDGVENSNPYFKSANWWGNANQWYLVTGHIWPAGSGTGTADVESGIYSMNGTKLSANNDFVWLPTAASAYHRSYMYYSTDITTNQQFYQPRVDVIDGTEPTISELLSDIGNTWYDSSGNNKNARFVNNVGYQSTTGGVLKFDGIDDYVNITSQPIISTAPNQFTITGFINPDNQNSKIITPQSNGIDQYLGYDPVNQRLQLGVTEISDINNRSFYTATNSVPLNTWTHLAISINDKNIKMYLSGEKVYETNETINIGGWSSNWFIGQRGGNTYFYKGMIGQINIFNRELKADEVRANFDNNKSRYGL